MPCEDFPCCGHEMGECHNSDKYDDDDFDYEYDDYDESMDGDFDSGMESAGYGTDEDYGYYGCDGFAGYEE